MYENGKMRPAETIPEMGEGDNGKWLKVWTQLWYIEWTLVNVTMHSSIAIIKKSKNHNHSCTQSNRINVHSIKKTPEDFSSNCDL
jgi:hypothetical protein